MRSLLFFIFAFFWVNAYSQTSYRLDTIAQGVPYPWSVAFLPGGDYLVALRGGELRRISADGEVSPALANTPATFVKGQGGYFDVLLDPDFANNQQIFLSFAHGDKSANATRIIKARLESNSLEDIEIIYTVSPSKDTPAHYGGRMLFLNDNTLVMTTGDGFQYREASQDPLSDLGKIIRINRDGSVPADNPFADGNNGSPTVYSLGHRSPQGLDYDAATNTLYMHEHGPKGGDEVNIVKPGKNYGWPVTSHGVNYSGARVSPFTERPGIESPLHVWTPSIAPSGLSYYNGSAFLDWRGNLFVGALVTKDVRRLKLVGGAVTEEEILFSELGARIRDVRTGPDGLLYLLTDEENGKLVRVSPQ